MRTLLLVTMMLSAVGCMGQYAVEETDSAFVDWCKRSYGQGKKDAKASKAKGWGLAGVAGSYGGATAGLLSSTSDGNAGGALAGSMIGCVGGLGIVSGLALLKNTQHIPPEVNQECYIEGYQKTMKRKRVSRVIGGTLVAVTTMAVVLPIAVAAANGR